MAFDFVDENDRVRHLWIDPQGAVHDDPVDAEPAPQPLEPSPEGPDA